MDANEGCSSEDIRAMAISFMIEKNKNGSSPSQPQQSSGGGKSFEPPVGDQGYGFCDKCNAPNVKSPKTGKTFCSAKCWV